MELTRALMGVEDAWPGHEVPEVGNASLTQADRRLVAVLQEGLPLVSRPYAAIGARVGLSEEQVLARLSSMLARGIIKRMGVIVRHHELGYRANAMVVWDIPDERVAQVGRAFSRFPFVTLCYRRPRRPPAWPYNLFCMIHGRDREAVLAQARQLAQDCGLEGVRHELLFSKRRFKQCGAHYIDSQGSRRAQFAQLQVPAETADG